MKHLIVIATLVSTLSSTGGFVFDKVNKVLSARSAIPERFLSCQDGDGQHVQGKEFYSVDRPRSYKLRSRQPQTLSRKRICVARPLYILEKNIYNIRKQTELRISTGFTFDDGDQLLVSAQKPLGLILEERAADGEDCESTTEGNDPEEREYANGCVVAEVLENSAAERAGVKPGDFLVAVQNADVTIAHFEEVMQRIADAPQVVNLRFWRKDWDDGGFVSK